MAGLSLRDGGELHHLVEGRGEVAVGALKGVT